jgi:signal transduction histidine kinase
MSASAPPPTPSSSSSPSPSPSPSPRPPLSLSAAFALAEIALTLAEILFIGAPLVELASPALHATGLGHRVAPLVASLLLLAGVRAADSLRPVFAARAAKRAGRAVDPAQVEVAQRAMTRAPIEAALVRWAIWVGAAVYVAVRLYRAALLPLPSATGLVTATILHAGGIAALRAIVWERIIGGARRAILPNLDPLREFATGYRRRLWNTAAALFGVTFAVNGALVAVFTDLSSRQAGMLLSLTLPAMVLPALVWYRSLARRTGAIERYLDAAVRHPGIRGPAREDPRAVAAYRSAQSMPYRLAIYQALAATFVAVAVVAVGRSLSGFDTASARRLLAATALNLLSMWLYETLLLRDVLRPLLGQLGARHRLPVAEVRSAVSLRTKLVLFFSGISVFTAGVVLLFAFSPTRALGTMLGSVALAIALALGLVLLIVRDMVEPIRALEQRSDEMARGELARPVPPSGEADEIGRLTFAFEEMRRALRDKLRTTESLNIDLEREVRRRTEVLEQRNGELREALEKLRRAQDDLVRTEKLASMGRLVAGIAHEINNPVNAVINTLGPLSETINRIAQITLAQHQAGAGPGAPAPGGQTGEATEASDVSALAREATEMLRVVERGAARSKAIVQALHNYSRGDDEIPRELNLVRSVDDTLDLLRHRLTNVRVDKQIEPGLRVSGFAGQIDQVFMNLITNAAQAIGDRAQGGTIRVSAARAADEVEIAIADDGPGIPPAVISRIFDPFFTTKDVGEGSGLGLSIVHGIVERHGGRIRVDSQVGEGTTFRITLPVATTSAVAVQPR